MLTLLVLVPLLLFGIPVDEALLRTRERVFRDALRHAGFSLEKIALYMAELDKGQLSRQLAGEGHLSDTRLLLTPVEFRRWYHVLWLAELGVPDTLLRVEPVMKMAKMAMPEAASEKRSA